MLTKMIAVAAALCCPAPRWRKPPDDLRGTWVLVSSVTDKDGMRTEQFGSGARGMMTLDEAGHFMLTIIGPGPATVCLQQPRWRNAGGKQGRHVEEHRHDRHLFPQWRTRR